VPGACRPGLRTCRQLETWQKDALINPNGEVFLQNLLPRLPANASPGEEAHSLFRLRVSLGGVMASSPSGSLHVLPFLYLNPEDARDWLSARQLAVALIVVNQARAAASDRIGGMSAAADPPLQETIRQLDKRLAFPSSNDSPRDFRLDDPFDIELRILLDRLRTESLK
jgi:hypothetical protein